jgi:hypothetical protein
MNYAEFLNAKTQSGADQGFEPLWMPDCLFDFQQSLTEWSLRKGRSAQFADCGLGKTLLELVWGENVARKVDKPVLILTPLAVAHQTLAEAHKFGIEATRSLRGEIDSRLIISNYDRLHYFRPEDFGGVVCDESGILKSFDGATRRVITEFMRKVPYRLLDTATAAPNDYIELGTSSEALGYLGYMDMLTRFFKNDQNTSKPVVYRHAGQSFQKLEDSAKWRFKGHAETPFWQWVCSWARAVRRPSDLGFKDDGFILPPLIEHDHLVDVKSIPNGMLFSLPAVGLAEQREERRRSIRERCERVAELVNGKDQSLVWCHLNDEGKLLSQLIPDSVEIAGSDPEEAKEEAFIAFAEGKLKRLITKPKIGALGLNFQSCHHVTFFPSHSYEQYYQGVRRCWRFGQKNPVTVDVVTSEGEKSVLQNLQRKAKAADRMFDSLVHEMHNAQSIERSTPYTKAEIMPGWL